MVVCEEFRAHKSGVEGFTLLVQQKWMADNCVGAQEWENLHPVSKCIKVPNLSYSQCLRCRFLGLVGLRLF